MLTASIDYVDGYDYVVISQTPWYAVWLENIASKGLNTGILYSICSRTTTWCAKQDQELIRFHVPHGCDAAAALWPGRYDTCDHDSLESETTEIEAEDVDMGTQITDAINADPGEVNRISRARLQARKGKRRVWSEVHNEIERSVYDTDNDQQRSI